MSQHFRRYDESDDADFYRVPRMVTHIDDAAIAAIRQFYGEVLPRGAAILDLMSSWVSHLPDDGRYATVTGLGMNAEELAANAQLSHWVVHDLNADPVLPFADGAFDAATVAFGIRNVDDLDRGLAEMARVVRPGGRVAILEITTPARMRRFYELWFDRVVPRLGWLLGRDAAAYAYLPASVRRFPGPPELAARMAAAGLRDIRWRPLAFGIVAIHHGRVA